MTWARRSIPATVMTMTRAAGASLGLSLCLGLAGCAAWFANPAGIAPGTPDQQIIAKFGQPTARYPLPGGGARLQYARGMGRVYNVDLNAQGQAVQAEQALDEALFANRIIPDHWTREDVQREYGPPTRIMRVHNFDGDIWVWRYNDIMDGARLLYIDIDPGGIVRGYSVGDDERPDFVGMGRGGHGGGHGGGGHR
jgi:hypothetical protein